MNIVYRSVKGSKLTSDEVDGNFQYLESLVGGTGNALQVETGFTLVGQDLTINSGWIWNILGVSYSNSSSVVITIPFAASGKERIDLIVANQSNSFIRVPGVESDSNPIAPSLPNNTVLVTFYQVTDGVVATPTTPLVGAQFKQKNESQKFTSVLGGTDAEIKIQTFGQQYYAVIGPVTSIAGFSKELILASSTAEMPYGGKDFYFENKTDHDVTLKNSFSSVDIPFNLGSDLVVPTNGIVWLKYNAYTEKMDLFFKSWSDLSSKLDKVTTVDVDKFYMKKADGTQDMKPLSEIGMNDLYKHWFSVTSGQSSTPSLLSVNTNAPTEVGTQSLLSMGGTSRLDSFKFRNYKSATTAGANAGVKEGLTSNAIYRNGVDAYFVFGNNNTNSNFVTAVGSYGLTSALPNLNISDFTSEFVGVGNDSTDANLSFFSKRASSASTVKVPLGSDFPAHTTTDAYLLRIEIPQTETATATFAKLTITNLITGITAIHTFDYTQIPTIDKNFLYVLNINNRNTGVEAEIKFSKIHVTRKTF